jgi:hypothetical protein
MLKAHKLPKNILEELGITEETSLLKDEEG